MIYILVMPAIVLIGHRDLDVRESVSDVSIFNPGAHGFTELIYAFTSAGNNNGSAFAGLTAQHRLHEHARWPSRCCSGASS